MSDRRNPSSAGTVGWREDMVGRLGGRPARTAARFFAGTAIQRHGDRCSALKRAGSGSTLRRLDDLVLQSVEEPENFGRFGGWYVEMLECRPSVSQE